MARSHIATVAAVLICAQAGWAQPLAVPSGQPLELTEVLVDDSPGETWLRFRLIAPQIARESGAIAPDVAAQDMDHLCEVLAIPYVAEYALNPARVVISLSDRVVEFGAPAPEATQFFEAYRLEDTGCIWEGF